MLTRRDMIRTAAATAGGVAASSLFASRAFGLAEPVLAPAPAPRPVFRGKMSKLQILQVGVGGSIAPADRDQLTKHADVVFAGLCDVDSDALANVAKDHPQAFTCRDFREAFDKHGDKFDAAVHHAPWLSKLGDVGYNLLLALNTVFNAARRRLGFGYWSLSSAIKRKVKQATSFIGNFEAMVTRHAAQLGCEGVVCGHIHTPKISQRDGVCYYNTGDWVESCTALVEYEDGRMELLHRPLNQWGSAPPGSLDRSDGKRSRPDVSRGPVSESTSNESPPFRHAGVFDFAGSVTTPEPTAEGVPQESAAVTTA